MTFKYEVGEIVWYRGVKYTVKGRHPPQCAYYDPSYELDIVLDFSGNNVNTGYVVHPSVSNPCVFEFAVRSAPFHAQVLRYRELIAERDCSTWEEVVGFISEQTVNLSELLVNGSEEVRIHNGRISFSSTSRHDVWDAMLRTWEVNRVNN